MSTEVPYSWYEGELPLLREALTATRTHGEPRVLPQFSPYVAELGRKVKGRILGKEVRSQSLLFPERHDTIAVFLEHFSSLIQHYTFVCRGSRQKLSTPKPPNSE